MCVRLKAPHRENSDIHFRLRSIFNAPVILHQQQTDAAMAMLPVAEQN